MSDQDTVDRLYPSQEAKPTPVNPPEAAEQATVDRLYPQPATETAGNPYAVDADAPENRFYGESRKVGLPADVILAAFAATDEEQATLAENLGFMADEIGASQADLRGIIAYAQEAVLTGENFTDEAALTALIKEHGYATLAAHLDDAALLAQSLGPDMVAWLEQTRLGNDPKMVSFFIRMAQTPRGKERLSQIKKRS